jgi:hypothetical protein
MPEMKDRQIYQEDIEFILLKILAKITSSIFICPSCPKQLEAKCCHLS